MLDAQTPTAPSDCALVSMPIVTVIYHHEPEGWWAESPDARGFFAAGQTREEVQRLVYRHLPRILGAELTKVRERWTS